MPKYSRAAKIEAAKTTRSTKEMYEFAYFPKQWSKSKIRRAHQRNLKIWDWLK